ncbi:DUF3703 domain-containing protein [Nafulsella turpanensis]|uniref:DUF3703 domain-containing protein n=1 Tax=Nafulsella turpanensis TaxID=1265690 RepID=UPI00037E78B6|nr:DUF3703 domain-containing protein [Nafulsella turpanensis]
MALLKCNTVMPARLKPFYAEELLSYRVAFAAGDLPLAWYHLERAHIIGQAYPWEHTKAHWLMLRFGFSIKSWKEVRGQVLRLLVGGVKSFVGKIPVGNTGGAKVPPLLSMPLPPDLQAILERKMD